MTGAALLTAALAASALAAQQPAKLLTFDVVALDDRGNFVGDLRRDEFQVFDNGRRQEIAWFLPGERASAPPSSLGPREYSNRGYGAFPHALAVVMDQLQGKFELKSEVWDKTLGALRGGSPDLQKSVYLYLLTRNGVLYPLHGLPQSWVDDAAHRAPWVAALPALFDDMRNLYRAQPAPADPDLLQKGKGDQGRAVAPGWALQELATRLATVPGSRSIVWIGAGGWGWPVLENVPYGRIPVYRVPVDMAPVGQAPRKGKTRGIGETIARALADAQICYRIGYFPESPDGRSHRLRVTCSRRGLQIASSREEYRAVKPVDLADDRREEAPDLVPLCPFDASAIRLRARVQSRAPSAVTIELRAKAPQPAGPLAIQPVIYTADEQVEVLQEPMLAGRTGTVTLRVRTGENAREVRLVVLDRVSDTFGTLTVPVEKP